MKIQLFDPEVGICQTEVDDGMEKYPHLVNESHVLGLTVLQEEDDDQWALGLPQSGGACTPWFDTLEELQDYCSKPESRGAMRERKARMIV